jgi:Domain of unknown function (DUF1929)/FG-GAP-like repeat
MIVLARLAASVVLFIAPVVVAFNLRPLSSNAIAQDRSVVGEWSPVYNLKPQPENAAPIGLAPMHMTVLPNGKVLMWDRSDRGGPLLDESTNTWIWNPSVELPDCPNVSCDITDSFQQAVNSTTALFCSGHTLLENGRVFVVGGALGPSPGSGHMNHTNHTNVFDYRTMAWVSGPNMPEVRAGLKAGVQGGPSYHINSNRRWYASAVTLANGEILVAAGNTFRDAENGQQVSHTPIVFTKDESDPWRELDLENPAQEDPPPGAPWEEWYPFLFVGPDGRAFRAGGSDAHPQPTGYLDTTGAGSWTVVPSLNNGNPLNYYASAVMYRPGEILVVGGGDGTGVLNEACTAPVPNPTNAARIINLNATSPEWKSSTDPSPIVDGMKTSRTYQNATLLPDGKVLVTGGYNAAGPVYKTEMWTPGATLGQQWKYVADIPSPRGYHATAVLLRDGSVLSAGGQCHVETGTNSTMEIYKPPYFFQGERPQITFVREHVGYNRPFTVTVNAPAVTDKIVLMRLPSVTHHFDANQRLTELPVTLTQIEDTDVLSTSINDPNQTPPGHYMLFVVRNGLPSELAEIIRVGGFAPGEIDLDVKSDLAIYRPGSSGTWYFSKSGKDFTTSTSHIWGTSGDLPVGGDYDGDGQIDLAVHRPSTGQWFVRTSTTNYTAGPTPFWGTTGDVLLSADQDGDAKSDIIVYRPSNGTWHILKSSTDFLQSQTFFWGTTGDVPAPGDYDGDGRMDLVVYRPASQGYSNWVIRTSSSGYTNLIPVPWGESVHQDRPVPADYDGDGVTDIAVYRPADQTWRIRASSTLASWLFYTDLGANSNDIPSAGDYDGDGKADLAMYRTNTGQWYIKTSTSNYQMLYFEWGIDGDIAVLRHNYQAY